MADCRDQIDVVAADLAEAAFWNAGQNCSAGSRILVDRSIKEEFVAALAREAQQRTVGDPADEATVNLGAVVQEGYGLRR
jgi:gamma-glutamyl-gamma-aminobutyraldehyde dehydrogenase